VVLLVEDNEPVREVAKSQLADLGYKVLVASNGRDALEIVKEDDDIDLLFTDLVMPGGMCGHELAHEARRLSPNLKVLYSSGYSDAQAIHPGQLDEDEKNVELLNKPYTRIELARKIRAVLTQS
jgi:CheY-like chemotaxis protein